MHNAQTELRQTNQHVVCSTPSRALCVVNIMVAPSSKARYISSWMRVARAASPSIEAALPPSTSNSLFGFGATPPLSVSHPSNPRLRD